MNKEDKEKFLKDNGWHTWYNEEYWVHQKTISDSSRQDYTNYGMSLDKAYEFETNKSLPFKPLPPPFGTYIE